jgi:hypothetical protein
METEDSFQMINIAVFVLWGAFLFVIEGSGLGVLFR